MTNEQLEEIRCIVYWAGNQFKNLEPKPDWCNYDNHIKYNNDCELCAANEVVRYLRLQGLLKEIE